MPVRTVQSRDIEIRLQTYLNGIAAMLGHASRASSMRDYCTGLLLPGERKSTELIAARVAPDRVQAAYQAMHHFVAKAAWDDAAMLRAVRNRVLPALERHGPVRFWAADCIMIPKQGKHSVGVATQVCDDAGRQACQTAACLSVFNEHGSLSVAYRLFLPRAWADDPARRARAGVPDGIWFEPRAAIALGQIRDAHAAGVPPGIVLGGPILGEDAGFRSGVNGLGLDYMLAVRPSILLWVCPAGPGTPPVRRRRDTFEPAPARSVVSDLPARAWRKVGWREAGRARASSRFAAVRVAVAHNDQTAAPGRDEWLLAEWQGHEPEPAGFWLSSLSPDTTLQTLVDAAKASWRIRRDQQELRQRIGLDHYEGRGWRGFHHHASLCVAAYGFLVAERCLFPAAQRFDPERIALPERPQGFRPRGFSHAKPTTTGLPPPGRDTLG